MNQSEPYVAIDALADHLSVSVSTVRKWVREGIIPTDTYLKVGTTYRFKISGVENALSAEYVESDDDSPLPILD